MNETMDILKAKFSEKTMVEAAKSVLRQEEQSEEAFLGARAVLMLNELL